MNQCPDNDETGLLAEMMALGRGSGGKYWSPPEMAAILKHQLDAPLALDLESFQPGWGKQVERLCSKAGPPLRTFADLFNHPKPPVELLKLTKEFAKGSARREDSPLPRDIAHLLYALSIVVALARHGCRLSELDDRDLQRLIDWASALPWIDSSLRDLLQLGKSSQGKPPPQDIGAPRSEPNGAPEADSGPARLMSASPEPLGRLGEYALLARLGEGGMGTVYKAVHTAMDRLVAIKIIRQNQLEEEWALPRFRREIKAVARLDHGNIVRAYDARTIGDTHFLVMEFVDGLDLNELVVRNGPLRVADACELIRQAALGLQCAHEHGLVHRDIKPSNLMLNCQGQVKILDLGLARLPTAGLGSAPTVLGQVMGTPDYMAPEQASDCHAVDIRADIYSLGCTLYWLLTGTAPFGGPTYKDLMTKLAAHQGQPPPPVHQFRGDIPEELSTVLNGMLAKSPEARLATPAIVADALSRPARSADLKQLLSKTYEGGTSTHVAEVDRQKKGDRLPRRLWLVAAGLAVLGILTGLVGWGIKHGFRDRNPTVTSTQPETAPVPSTPTELPGWIVLSWTRPRLGKPNLWLFRPDGNQRVNVTNDPRYFDIHPKFSPDGRRIAFIRGESLTAPNSVYVCNSNGRELRPLVTPRDKSERFASPVWGGPGRLYYTRAPRFDRDLDMEVWQADLDGSTPRLLFRMQDATGKGCGVVTDVSPDGRHLALIAQMGGFPTTADVYVSDLQGQNLQTVWVDAIDGWRDARALWSPDGKKIAWHRNFTRGLLEPPIYHGIGWAHLGPNGKWTARLQPTPEVFETPLAWSPGGTNLLCARIHNTGQRMPAANLFLMDDQFRTVQALFNLEASPWQPGHRDLARLADWCIIPPDIPIPTDSR